MREPVTSLLQLVVAARERFVRAGIPPNQAAIDAEVLARHLLQWDRATYLTRRDDPIAEADRRRYDELAARRERREPVAYITLAASDAPPQAAGRQPLCQLGIHVRRRSSA